MILLRFFGWLFDLLLLPLRVFRRGRAVPAGSYLTLEIDGPVVDLAPRPRFWRPSKATSVWNVSRIVDAMIADGRLRGIIVTIRELGGGLASASSLRAELARARAAGKEVVVHVPMGAMSKEMLVASVATKLVVGPAAQLAPLGFISTTRYLKRALEKAGVDAQIFACGEFKSAGEQLVRDDMSAPQRLQLERMLGSFHEALVSAIAEGRGVDEARAHAIIDGAPYFGLAAVVAGVADAVGYEDEVPALLGVTKKELVDAHAYLAFVTRPLLRAILRKPIVAVVPVHGTITHAAGMFEGLATDERVIRMVRAARMNRRVRGVVLHVDSPGGSALASDRMHHEIAQLAREKPLVVCMANVAASGGYYVAAPAKRIICDACTITGSIGVVGARITLDPLLARIGVTTEAVKRGERAGLLTNAIPLSEDERAALGRELDATYARFVGVVATGRGMDAEVVEKLARGRVYTGADALAAGLVDALGGFRAAMKEVVALLPERDRLRVSPEIVRLPRSTVPALDPPSASLLASLLPARERSIFELVRRNERVLALFTGWLP